MSAPTMNAVLPPSSGAAPPAPVAPLSLTVSPAKSQQAPVAASKPQTNHSAAEPVSLPQENKPKIPEIPKPTCNGVDEAEKPSEPPAASADVPVEVNKEEEKKEEVVSKKEVVSDSPPTKSVEPEAPVSPPTEKPSPPPPNKNEEESEDEKPAEAPKPKPPKAKAVKRQREPASQKVAESSTPEKKPRRTRAPVSPYQSPLPEITTVIKHSLREKREKSKPADEKLIVFYKNEYLAVRNAEGSFYLCQTLQNIYMTSRKIRIRWLSKDEKESTSDGGIFAADFYDTTDFECILTSVALLKKDKNKYKMPAAELERVESILKRALDVEKGVSEKPAITEEHPDGLDLSLYKDEAQLNKKGKKRSSKRKRSSSQKKKASPKRAKLNKTPQQTKNTAELNQTVHSKASTNKAKSRNLSTRRAPPVPSTSPKTSSRTERLLAREKAAASSKPEETVKVSSKKPKVNKNKPTKPEKPATVKPDKKVEKTKTKKAVSSKPEKTSKTSHKKLRGKGKRRTTKQN